MRRAHRQQTAAHTPPQRSAGPGKGLRRVVVTTAVIALAGFTLAACGGDGDGNGDQARTASGRSDPTSSTRSTEAAPTAPVIDPGDGGDYAPEIDPADFVAEIDNPYLPFQPGNRWVYEGTDDGEPERIEVEVTTERREVMGISAVVVRDTVSASGEVIEDTYDWYAQDREGNVWYLGEDTTEYQDGEAVGTEGSWEAGVDGALPGIVMPADPTVGHAYRQEHLPGEAEDMGEVIDVGDSESVAAGRYDDVVVTRDWTPLEPEIVEEKTYAPGVGLVLETKVAGGEGRIELVSFMPGA